MKAGTSGLLALVAGEVRWPADDILGGFMPRSVRLLAIHRLLAETPIVPNEVCKAKQIAFWFFAESIADNEGDVRIA